jgi:ABC-2 type transport system ATP-binding protein
VDELLAVEQVRKAWDVPALEDVSFRLPPGHIMGIAGPNGSGKTTLIRLILGLARADAGTIRILGDDVEAAGGAIRSRIGFVLDRPIAYEYLTVARLGRLVAGFYPSWDEAEFERLLDEFELPRRRRASALSRGMRVKLALALALSHHAELLVLDEPTTGLDPVFRRELLARLSALISNGRTSVLFSTQILTDLERVADFAIFLRQGKVLFSGPKDDLLDRWTVVRGGPEMAAVAGVNSVRGIRRSRMGFEVLFDDIDDARRHCDDSAVLDRPTLDDVFLLLGSREDR